MGCKLSIKILLIVCLQVLSNFSVFSQERKFDIDVDHGTIADVFNFIEDQSDYNIFYKVGQIDVSREISLHATGVSITRILDLVISQFNASYVIHGDMIVITPLKPNKKPEKHIITGTVNAAADGQPLAGVNVVQEGSGTGTTTDMNGRYTIDTDSGNVTLVFSYVGFLTRRVPVNSLANIDLSLYVDVARLDEVIILGYGGQKKGDVTGSIISLSSRELSDKGYVSFDQMLQGKAAGVEVINNSGMPGAGVSIKIRGIGTLYNTDPLYVIDGLAFRGNGDDQSNPLAMINPNDVESIQILKDASTSAIYGTRAANGVVIISTKKGKTGMPSFSFNSFAGVSYAHKKLDLLNAAEYLDLVRDIQQNGSPGKPVSELLPPRLYSNGNFTGYAMTDRTDWQNEIFRTGNIQDHSLSVSGGNGFFSYNFSGGYTKHRGIMSGNNYERYSFRSNTEFNLFRKFRIGENLGLSYSNLNPIDENLFAAALRIPPYLPVFDASNLGGYSKVTTIDDLNDALNPVAVVALSDRVNRSFRLLANMYACLEIVNGLTYKINLGIDYTHGYNFSFTKENKNGNLTSPSILYESYSWGITPTMEHTLEYARSNDRRAFSIIAGNTLPVKSTGKYLAVEGRGFSNEEIKVMPVADFTRIDGNATGSWQSILISYFGRINYSLLNRYLFTINFRRDASPRFSPQNRWGNFPSFSAGWKISQEDFFKNLNLSVSTLKLRAGWGKSGSDLIGDYIFLSSLHSTNINYVFGDPQKTVKGVTINSLPSPYAKWEIASTVNVGLDLGLFDNQLTFTTDYFIKNTQNILVQVPIPPSGGMGLNDGGGDPTINAASVENKGIEATLAIRNRRGKLKYTFSANIAAIKNKVTSLGEGQPLLDGTWDFGYNITRTEVGKPIGHFYGFVVDRVYSTQEEIDADNAMAAEATGNLETLYQEAAKPGDLRFVDLDKDGHITDKDRTMIGNPVPGIIYGLSGNLQYHGFDFSLSVAGVRGNKIFNAFYTYWLTGMIRPFNASAEVLDRWREPGDITDVPRAVANDPNKNLRPSTR
ncbi:MAG TPA: TonB-dependent receptor, partial [Bacteroidales bacterium]|nr:TonB-dependent receptor [Bacteroidales bacterium]